jgi:hypothetical protein
MLDVLADRQHGLTRQIPSLPKLHLFGSDTALYDTVHDVLEQDAISVSQDTAISKQARIELEAVLDSYPSKGCAVDRSLVRGGANQPRIFSKPSISP